MRNPDAQPRNLGDSPEDIQSARGPTPGEIRTERQEPPISGEQWLALQGNRDARSWQAGNLGKCSAVFRRRAHHVRRLLRKIFRVFDDRRAEGKILGEDEVWILDNARLLNSVCDQLCEGLKAFRGPSVIQPSHLGGDFQVPRIYAVAACFLNTVEFDFSESRLQRYLEGVQQVESLRMAELWGLEPMLQLGLLERIVSEGKSFTSLRARRDDHEAASMSARGGRARLAVQALHRIGDMEWKKFFERNNAAERVLQEEPSGTYMRMDYESRQLYRNAIEELAQRSLFSEEEVARKAVLLATRARIRAKRAESARAARRADVGYYLLDDGRRSLKKRLGYKPALKQHISEIILEWPEIYYLVGVELTTVALVFLLLGSLAHIIPLLAGLLLLIPASHAAVGLMNCLTAVLVRPRQIPKLDFSEGIPSEFTTLVVVPCLLLNEAEVRHNVELLEIRYLGNQDANLHFALLTDPPDASLPFDERDELVGLCSSLIKQLSQTYASRGKGKFLHLHRHRSYSAADGTWMGWERKRGKLIDLNNLLRGTFDSFPVKAGDLSLLTRARYVITLDSDTRLPRETAHRLVGALAHPLNRAYVDPRSNTVAEGYGILQPRISVSVDSARHSRLANIFSGESGFDVYTHAVSDVYQDLFGEGSFTGKGIYDVDVFQRVLGKRFPTNALLSHDLLEGSYARAGLVTDIEVVDDYPSHFRAYCRRLHRWVRGDWQIIRWLFSHVPDFHGRPVYNPLAFLSRWKIFDNLRRSLNDVGLFLLLVLGWVVLRGGPVYWTLVTLGLLLLPTYSQLAFSTLRMKGVRNWKGFFRERASDFFNGHLQVFIMLAFLPHQALVMTDAIFRTLVRLVVTRRNLLEWETAAEAETDGKRTPIETYLALTPWISLGIGVMVACLRPSALIVASPVLTLWLLADFFARWVSRPLRDQKYELSLKDESFLRTAGLLTWRFFREHSGAENHFLIPDNVQQDPPRIARRLSPTNLGLLLNARLAAYELGYLTLPEFVNQTEETLRTVTGLARFKGHLFNWYDTDTLQPVEPLFVSAVDSGNLAACLWTLKQSCIGASTEPLLSGKLWQGVRAQIGLLAELGQGNSTSRGIALAIRDLAVRAEPLSDDTASWIESLPWLEQQLGLIQEAARGGGPGRAAGEGCAMDQIAWWAGEAGQRVRSVHELVENFVPWALPEYASLPLDRQFEQLTLASLPSKIGDVERRLGSPLGAGASERTDRATTRSLRRRLQASVLNVARLSNSAQRLAENADRLVEEMDFGFLFIPKKQVLSIGYDVRGERVETYSYDLLASEARTAVFLAVAKGEVGQEAWFHLGRSRVRSGGQNALLSWSGTMFEYLMPTLWTRTIPGTILDQGLRAAVSCQRKFAKRNRVPWGISESAFSDRDAQGFYQYRAFGVPSLALDPHASENLVISPYSSFLALSVEPSVAVRNLHRMKKMGWMGPLGYFDSCDFRNSRKPTLVRTFMAHHQGMALLAICNLLRARAIQKWFHREPSVKAAELLLCEKTPLSARVEGELPHGRGKRKPEAQAATSQEGFGEVNELGKPTAASGLARANRAPSSQSSAFIRDHPSH